MKDIDNLAEEQSVETKKKKRISRKWLTFAFVLINIAALAYAVMGDVKDPEAFSFSLIADMISRNWYYLLLALLSVLIALMTRASLFYIMLRTTVKKASPSMCFSVAVLGKYYDSVTPFGTGGQPFQMMYLSKKGIEKGVAFSLPIAEYSFSRFSFVFLSFGALVLNFTDVFQTRDLISGALMAAALTGLTLCFIVPLFCVLFSFSRAFCSRIIKFVVGFLRLLKLTKDPEALYIKIMSYLEQYSSSFNKIASKIGVVLVCFLISIVSNLAICSIAFFSLKTFDYSMNANIIFEWAHVVILSLFVYNSVTYFPTPGNSGAADLSFYWIFSASLSGAAAVVMITWRVLSFYIFILLGLAFIIYDWNVRRRSELLKIHAQKENESP